MGSVQVTTAGSDVTMSREVEMGTTYKHVVEIARWIKVRPYFTAIPKSSYCPPAIQGPPSGYSSSQGQIQGQSSSAPRGCYEYAISHRYDSLLRICFYLQKLFQQHRDVSLKLAKHVFFSEFKGQQSIAKDLRKQTGVSLTLANNVIPTAGDTNMVFSPLSIHLMLGLVTADSSGRSRDELLSFLKSKSADDVNYLSYQLVSYVLVDGSPSGGPLLSAANSIWVDQSSTFKPSFRQFLDNVYKAASVSTDFATKFQVLLTRPGTSEPDRTWKLQDPGTAYQTRYQ
nr:probable non-inhibitory serpin-Z5 [Nicotiana tomentosiformis]